MTTRNVVKVVTAHQQREGGGFMVRRPFPTQGFDIVDPFLMLDEMGPVDYAPGEAVGAPDHPHRGFETVTYVLAGEMEHEDSAGHKGAIGPGDVQWMTAGDGVVHSEEPSEKMRTEGGRMHGFQLWVNLPKKDKRMKPRYQEIPAAKIPEATSADGLASVRVIAGEALGKRAVIETQTPIAYHDWTLRPGARVEVAVPEEYNAAVYVFGGSVQVGDERVTDGQLGMLGRGSSVTLAVPADATEPARVLLLAGKPLDEEVAWYGPFVMSTEAEIHEAIADFRAGRLGQIVR